MGHICLWIDLSQGTFCPNLQILFEFLGTLGITSGISKHGLGQGSLLLLVQEQGARTQMPKDAQGVRGPSPDL